MKFTQAEKKWLAGIEKHSRDHDTNGRIKSLLQETGEPGMFYELNDDGELVLRPAYKQQLVMDRRQIDAVHRIVKTLKRHFGLPYATDIKTLLTERDPPADVLLELTIEVEQQVAKGQSSDAILQYLQATAKPNLIIERKLRTINEERLQAERETEAERRLRRQSQQETEAERHLRIKETQEKEAERQLRIQSQQEIARLRQLLGQGVGTTTHSAPSSQTAQSTPTSSTAFWQTAPTDRTKKRGFDATDTRQLEAEAQSIEQPNKRKPGDISPTPSSQDNLDTHSSNVHLTNSPRGPS